MGDSKRREERRGAKGLGLGGVGGAQAAGVISPCGRVTPYLASGAEGFQLLESRVSSGGLHRAQRDKLRPLLCRI